LASFPHTTLFRAYAPLNSGYTPLIPNAGRVYRKTLNRVRILNRSATSAPITPLSEPRRPTGAATQYDYDSGPNISSCWKRYQRRYDRLLCDACGVQSTTCRKKLGHAVL